jgi:phage terminase small subunit
VAEYLAAGYSLHRATVKLGMDYKTAWEWTRKPEFAAYVAEVRDKLVQAQRPLYENSISIAQAIITRRLTGELDADDDESVALAERLLLATLWRTAKPWAAKDDGGDEGQRRLGGGGR